MALAKRNWVPQICETRVQSVANRTSGQSTDDIAQTIAALALQNEAIHTRECFNLNPATNIMNPKAEAFLSSGIGSRPSLGYPGDKYEMGLEAIEEIEIITAELCAEVFNADFAEIRVPSGAIANLYGFMATCQSGDTIIAPPPSIGGHVTHHLEGCAGLFGLKTIDAPIDEKTYSIDVDALRELCKKERPKLITVGSSLNLFEHPVREIREIADEIDAKVMFDAAHQCGVIAGRAWRDPLDQGAHFMTMSTYKSLGGPAGGLILSNDAEIVERLDKIAFPGLTANFDAAKSAALGITMLDWRDHGRSYAAEMITVAQSLATALYEEGLPVFASDRGFTRSHQFAVDATSFGGGQAASKHLRQAGFLACGIGLPLPAVDGDMNGFRIGTPELVRWGMKSEHTAQLASLIARGLRSENPIQLAAETADFRCKFNTLHFIN